MRRDRTTLGRTVLSFVLSIAMAFGGIPMQAFADVAQDSAGEHGLSAADVGLVVGGAAQEMTLRAAASSGQAARDPFDAYVERLIASQVGWEVAASGESFSLQAPRDVLTTNGSAVYDWLVGEVASVAAGDSSSTMFTIPVEDIYEVTSWDTSDLGIDMLSSSQDEVVEAINEALDVNVGTVYSALLAEHPYELYWRGDQYGSSLFGSYSSSEPYDTVEITGDLTFVIVPSQDYQGDGNYTIDTSRIDVVNDALDNAQEIASNSYTGSAYDTLHNFKEQICDLTSYNHAAADDDSTPYGDPWQLIWVFDGDPETTVVCEGYSKAFKYLCDLVSLSNVECRIVTGTMDGGTGAGAHMWDVVQMDDGENYLVDITNCDGDDDERSIGYPDALFLAYDGDGAGDAEGYAIDIDGSTISYAYDSDTRVLFSDAERMLTTTAYDGPVDWSNAPRTLVDDHGVTHETCYPFVIDEIAYGYAGGVTDDFSWSDEAPVIFDEETSLYYYDAELGFYVYADPYERDMYEVTSVTMTVDGEETELSQADVDYYWCPVFRVPAGTTGPVIISAAITPRFAIEDGVLTMAGDDDEPEHAYLLAYDSTGWISVIPSASDGRSAYYRWVDDDEYSGHAEYYLWEDVAYVVTIHPENGTAVSSIALDPESAGELTTQADPKVAEVRLAATATLSLTMAGDMVLYGVADNETFVNMTSSLRVQDESAWQELADRRLVYGTLVEGFEGYDEATGAVAATSTLDGGLSVPFVAEISLKGTGDDESTTYDPAELGIGDSQAELAITCPIELDPETVTLYAIEDGVATALDATGELVSTSYDEFGEPVYTYSFTMAGALSQLIGRIAVVGQNAPLALVDFWSPAYQVAAQSWVPDSSGIGIGWRSEDKVFVSSVRWYDVTEDTEVFAGDSFAANHEYTCSIDFDTYEGYRFGDEITFFDIDSEAAIDDATYDISEGGTRATLTLDGLVADVNPWSRNSSRPFSLDPDALERDDDDGYTVLNANAANLWARDLVDGWWERDSDYLDDLVAMRDAAFAVAGREDGSTEVWGIDIYEVYLVSDDGSTIDLADDLYAGLAGTTTRLLVEPEAGEEADVVLARLSDDGETWELADAEYGLLYDENNVHGEQVDTYGFAVEGTIAELMGTYAVVYRNHTDVHHLDMWSSDGEEYLGEYDYYEYAFVNADGVYCETYPLLGDDESEPRLYVWRSDAFGSYDLFLGNDGEVDQDFEFIVEARTGYVLDAVEYSLDGGATWQGIDSDGTVNVESRDHSYDHYVIEAPASSVLVRFETSTTFRIEGNNEDGYVAYFDDDQDGVDDRVAYGFKMDLDGNTHLEAFYSGQEGDSSVFRHQVNGPNTVPAWFIFAESEVTFWFGSDVDCQLSSASLDPAPSEGGNTIAFDSASGSVTVGITQPSTLVVRSAPVAYAKTLVHEGTGVSLSLQEGLASQAEGLELVVDEATLTEEQLATLSDDTNWALDASSLGTNVIAYDIYLVDGEGNRVELDNGDGELMRLAMPMPAGWDTDYIWYTIFYDEEIGDLWYSVDEDDPSLYLSMLRSLEGTFVMAREPEELERIDINTLAWDDVYDQDYTGEEVRPGVVIRDGDYVLAEDRDYIVTYYDNIEPGMATLQVTGIGNYQGEAFREFEIVKVERVDISSAWVDDAEFQFEPQMNEDDIVIGTVTLDGYALVEGTDFTVEYGEVYKPVSGLGKDLARPYTLIGEGNFTGTLAGEITVKPYEVDEGDISITLAADKMFYTGSRVANDPIKVTILGDEVKWGDQYGVTYYDTSGYVTPGTKRCLVNVYDYRNGLVFGVGAYEYEIVRPDVDIEHATVEGFAESVPYSHGRECLQSDLVVKAYDEAIGQVTLIEGVYYDLSYTNNREVGTATLRISDHLDPTKYQELEYVIERVDLADESRISVDWRPAVAQFTGAAIELESLDVSDSGYAMEEGVDFEVSYQDNIAAGQASVTLEGKGNYQGTRTIRFDIDPVYIDDLVDELDGTVTYSPTGTVAPGLSLNEGYDLVEGVDYEVEEALAPYYDSSEDTWQMVFEYTGLYRENGSGSGGFTGTGRLYAEVLPYQVQPGDEIVTVVPIEAQEHTGTAIEPAPVVKAGEAILVEGEDYTVSYENNVQVGGAAKAIVNFMGLYAGSLEQTFTITPQPIDLSDTKNTVVVSVSPATVEYDGTAKLPASVAVTVNGTELAEGMDFTYAVTNNVDAGLATITITGAGTYRGSYVASDAFRITARDIAGATVEVADAIHDGTAKTPEPAVTYGGTALVKGTDYTLAYANNTQVGEATVTVTGVGNYAGARDVTFLVVSQADTAWADVPVADDSAEGVTASVPEDTQNELDEALVFVAEEEDEAAVEEAQGAIHQLVSEDALGGVVLYDLHFEDAEGTEVAGDELPPTILMVTLAVPNGWTAARTRVLYIPEEGDVVDMGAVASADGATVSFLTSHFSNYAMVLERLSIEGLTVTIAGGPFTYTGEQIEPQVTVTGTVNGAQVTLGSDDYDVTYGANVNAGTGAGSVTVTGKGDYTGTVVKSFDIVGADAAKVEGALNGAYALRDNATVIASEDDPDDLAQWTNYLLQSDYDALVATINAAEELLGTENRSVAQVDAMYDALFVAMEKGRLVQVDTEALQTAIDAAEAFLTGVTVEPADGTGSLPDGTEYLAAVDAAVMQQEIDAAKALLDDSNRTQNAVNQQAAFLDELVSNVTLSTVEVERSALDELGYTVSEDLWQMPISEDGKTWTAANGDSGELTDGQAYVMMQDAQELFTALLAASSESNRADATQDEIDAATSKLEAAYAAFNTAKKTYSAEWPFVDVKPPDEGGKGGTAHWEDINWMYYSGISQGWEMEDGTRQYRPLNNVARADMAAFLYRLAGSPEYEPSAADKAYFTDVNDNTPHAREIWWMAHKGISKGWDMRDGTHQFRPYANVARCDMAAFLYRLAGSPKFEPTDADRAYFSDVSSSTAHATEVWWMASTGVSAGWTMEDGTHQFRPLSNVARADMAAFLHRMHGRDLVPMDY